MSDFYRIVRSSLADFRRTYKQYLVFVYAHMLLSSFVFVPALAYMFNRVLRAIGSKSLLNSEVYTLALSYKGIIGMTLIGLVAVILLFIQLAALIAIAQQSYFNRRIRLAAAAAAALRQTPRVFGFGLLQLALLLFILAPLIGSPLLSALFDSVNMPIYMTAKLDAGSYLPFVYAALLGLALYLALRWMFALHFMVIENASIRAAMKSSMALTRKHGVALVLNLGLINLLAFAIVFCCSSLLAYWPATLEIPVLRFAVGQYLLTFFSLLLYMFTLLLIPLNVIFVTRLFYMFRFRQGVVPRDRLPLDKNGLLAGLEARLALAEEKLGRLLWSKTNKRKYALLTVMALYVTVMFAVNHAINDNVMHLKWRVQIASHRGDMLAAPENSLSAIRSALAQGVDAIEIDVQLAKDGVIVLHHDQTLARTAGAADRVADLTYAQLARLSIGRGYGEEFAGERIPTLEQVLAEVGGQTKLIVEIKPYGEPEKLAAGVVRLIEQYELTDSSYVQSFHGPTLAEVRRLNPDIRIGQILYLAAGSLSSLDVDFYTVRQSMLSERLIAGAHKSGREVWVWTVNIERNMKEVLKYNIDGIITDYPERLQRLMGLHIKETAGEEAVEEDAGEGAGDGGTPDE